MGTLNVLDISYFIKTYCFKWAAKAVVQTVSEMYYVLYPTMGLLQVRDGAGTKCLGREVSAPARVMSIMSGKIY